MSERQFRGGVFSAKLTGGRAGATLYVLPELLRARTDGGEQFDLPYPEVHLELGGASGRMLFCRNPEHTVTLFCEAPGYIFALTSVAGRHISDKMAPVHRDLARQQRRKFYAAGALLALLLGLGLGLPPLLRNGLRLLVHSVPYSLDEKLGSAVVGGMDLGGPPLQDPVVVGAVQILLNRLEPHVTLKQAKFTAHVINRDEANAFALPGGQLVVYSGLLRLAQGPDQLAAVLAHEMGHVVHRHGLQRIAQSVGVVATVQFFLGDVGGALALGKELLTVATINNYSRNDESQADTTAVQLLHAAHLDPRALATFFSLLAAQESKAVIPSWISSHPALADRLAAVQAQAAELPQIPTQPLPQLDWPTVQAHLPRSTAEAL